MKVDLHVLHWRILVETATNGIPVIERYQILPRRQMARTYREVYSRIKSILTAHGGLRP